RRLCRPGPVDRDLGGSLPSSRAPLTSLDTRAGSLQANSGLDALDETGAIRRLLLLGLRGGDNHRRFRLHPLSDPLEEVATRPAEFIAFLVLVTAVFANDHVCTTSTT